MCVAEAMPVFRCYVVSRAPRGVTLGNLVRVPSIQACSETRHSGVDSVDMHQEDIVPDVVIRLL